METKKENTKEIVEKNLEKWCNLQKLIKEEITLNDISTYKIYSLT